MFSKVVVPPQPSNFPLLAKATDSIELVIFTDSNTGVVIVAGSAQRPIGFFVDAYIYDEDYWEVLPVGTQVILTQAG